MISLPPLTLVKVLEQADKGGKFGLLAPCVFVMISAALVLIVLVLYIPTDWLKGELPPIMTLILVEVLDFLFQWYALAQLAEWIRFP